ncbi:MAG: hypothetical protein EZS28_048202, partial [Streblomastix strix]
TNGDAPSPRTNHTCVGYGDSLIIFGGYDKDDQLCNDMYQYNINDRKWKRIQYENQPSDPNIPPPIFLHTAVILNDKDMFIFGGGNLGKASEKKTQIPQGTLYKFDLITRYWTVIRFPTNALNTLTKKVQQQEQIQSEREMNSNIQMSEQSGINSQMRSHSMSETRNDRFKNSITLPQSNKYQGTGTMILPSIQKQLLSTTITNAVQTLPSPHKHNQGISRQPTPQTNAGISAVNSSTFSSSISIDAGSLSLGGDSIPAPRYYHTAVEY